MALAMGWHPSYVGKFAIPEQLRRVLDYPVKPDNDGISGVRAALVGWG